jgi:hypothetical protein
MSISKKVQQTHEPLPSFFVRWFIFFRLHPNSFLQPGYLFSVLFMSWRHPVLWDAVMEAERRRKAKIKDEELFKNSN